MDNATSEISTVPEWEAALRQSADVLVTKRPRPARAGNIAGALRAVTRNSFYSSQGVVHQPGSGEIVITTSEINAQTTASRLRKLKLPGMETIEFDPGTGGDTAKVTIKLVAKPQA